MQTAIKPRPTEVSQLSEPVLIDLAVGGDEAAVRAIVQRHNRSLFRVARAVLRDDAEAEDVVQETYVRAFTHLSSFRGGAALATWLTRIALNEAYGRLRRRRPTVEIGTAAAEGEQSEGRVIMFPTLVSSSSPESDLGRQQVARVLEQAIDDLPDPFRMVFVLREVEDLSIEETAAHLSIKPQTVKTRLHRARRLLRAALNKRLTPAFADIFPFDGVRCRHMADRVLRRLEEVRRRDP